ncbi:hypothetical protein SUDANB145_07285 (plasmid) [Streptomyces sp. enrichment culture]|uniref:hypothetical protein n=1 Tax=Streptomyces sp. enrichment culture TaxID=1795815 RepID=UPI003F542C40
MTAYSNGVEIACDGPDEETACPNSAAVRARFGSLTARQVRADGRKDGWTTRRVPGHLRDVCPTCRTR